MLISSSGSIWTNKLQSVGGSFSASLYFVRRGAVKLREQRLNIAMTFLGAIGGTPAATARSADRHRRRWNQ
jgi:uncharacterized membrane protein YfcA